MLVDGLSLESEWQQVFRTLHNILTYLNNAGVWIVSSCPLISKSSGPFTKPWRAPFTIDIAVTFMLHCFFFLFLALWQGLSTYLSFDLLLFLLCDEPEQQNPLFGRFSFLLTITWSGCLVEIICLYLKTPENFASHSPCRILGWLPSRLGL